MGGNKLIQKPDLKQFANPEFKEPQIFLRNETQGFALIEDDLLGSEVYGTCLNLLDLCSSIITSPDLQGIISFGMLPLMKIISNFLLLTKEEEIMWNEDFNQYVSSDEDEHDMTNIKNLVYQIFNNLIEMFLNSDEAIKGLMSLIDFLLFNKSKEEMSNLFTKLLKSGILITN